jgi:hypothetical protein
MPENQAEHYPIVPNSKEEVAVRDLATYLNLLATDNGAAEDLRSLGKTLADSALMSPLPYEAAVEVRRFYLQALKKDPLEASDFRMDDEFLKSAGTDDPWGEERLAQWAQYSKALVESRVSSPGPLPQTERSRLDREALIRNIPLRHERILRFFQEKDPNDSLNPDRIVGEFNKYWKWEGRKAHLKSMMAKGKEGAGTLASLAVEKGRALADLVRATRKKWAARRNGNANDGNGNEVAVPAAIQQPQPQPQGAVQRQLRPRPPRDPNETGKDRRRRRMDEGAAELAVDRDKIETANKTRKVLGVLFTVALTISAGAFSDELEDLIPGFGSGIETSELKIPNWKIERSELYPISPQNYDWNPPAKEDLESLQKAGLASKEVDRNTFNYYNPYWKEELIDAPVVIRSINGHDVRMKKPVMDYFEAAWNLLGEYGYPFEGDTSDFRTNIEQFELCKKIRGNGGTVACSAQTGGLHSGAQGADIAGSNNRYFSTDTATAEGQVVAEVLQKFGFSWGDHGPEKMGAWKRTKSVVKTTVGWFMKKKEEGNVSGSATDLIDTLERNDKVHFQMTKTSHDEMEKKGGIEAAKKRAREYLESRKKK